ncbi:hypothetical protein QYM36_006008 [Artemia franciscana]|uniref:Uncharacterized protein n=1 Tax=Artemia franciscana TaxID=6661 RepID=A0AA88HXC6_ARTSF|nr:hypothetical protein QYM36_006008 [Artemia franciscana]
MVHFHPSHKWHTSYPKEISIDVCLPIFIKTFSLGTLFGITNGVSMLVSWLGPVMVGFMTDENQTLEAWSAVFIMAGSVLAADSIFFLIFGSGSEQFWNYKAEGENDEIESRMNTENNPPIVKRENTELP